jgi:ribosome modulation factor
LDALTKMKNTRAFQEGYAAYIAKFARHAPARFGVFSGHWVEGWEAAAIDAADLRTKQEAESALSPQ